MLLQKERFLFVALLLPAFFMLGCAGPTDPFGAELWRRQMSARIGQTQTAAQYGEQNDVAITFNPPFQNWHNNHHVSITVDAHETISPQYDLRLYYNGRDLTEDLMEQAVSHWEKLGTRLVINLPKLRFLPGRQNELGIYFRANPIRDFTVAHYRTPECPLQDNWSIDREILPSRGMALAGVLENESHKQHINPAMMVGLIQQESNFNGMAVSSAKAIGLTQVTPVASKEVLKRFPQWPEDERSSELPVSVLRLLIQSRAMTNQHDWRLDEVRSIQGGVAYLDHLARLWQLPDYRLILSTLEQPAIEDIILASYHSGPNRVRDAIRTHSDQWSLSNELRQARYYIGKVKSYCSLHSPQRMAKR